MLKCLISLALALGCMNGATIITSAQCHDSIVFGTTSAQCDLASATIVANPVYRDSVSLSATADVDVIHTPLVFRADATFIDDYTLTITGGTGQGFFGPCLFAGPLPMNGFESIGSASFGDVSINSGFGGFADNCQSNFDSTLIPFTFDVPQTFTISLYIRADAGFGMATLNSFQFFGVFPGGGAPDRENPLTNVHFTLVSVDLPEPSTFYLLIGGLVLLMAFGCCAKLTVFQDLLNAHEDRNLGVTT